MGRVGATATLAAVATVLAGLLTTASAGPLEAQATCLGKRATIVGTARPDKVTGTSRVDVIVGLGGNDTLRGGRGNDLICGGSGADVIRGGAGRDSADGGPGRDVCPEVERTVRCELPAPPSPPSPSERELFFGSPLPPATYVNSFFRPPVSFTIGPGWEARASGRFASLFAFAIVRNRGPRTQCASESGLFLVFNHFSLHDSVADVVAHLSTLPGTSATPPLDATVGGVSGKQLELTATGAACLRVADIGEDLTIDLDPGDRIRYYVLDINGLTVIVSFGGPSRLFESFATVAEPVVASVRWR
jgi:Ca2+-binding RTX toxin-like protein